LTEYWWGWTGHRPDVIRAIQTISSLLHRVPLRLTLRQLVVCSLIAREANAPLALKGELGSKGT
jgi:hypothetical protein